MSATAQSSLSAFEQHRPIPKGRSAELNALVTGLGISKVQEPKADERGRSWSDDSQISTQHYKREALDPELTEYEDS
jgi:hypothetical protein